MWFRVELQTPSLSLDPERLFKLKSAKFEYTERPYKFRKKLYPGPRILGMGFNSQQEKFCISKNPT